jgi:hypothetical protein
VTGRTHEPPFGWVEVVAMATSAALCVSRSAPVPSTLRFLLSVMFVAFGPGTAILVVLGARAVASLRVGLVVALGMATTALVSESLLWIGAFYPRPTVAVAAGAVFTTVAMASWRSRTRSGTARGSDALSGHVDPEMRPGDRMTRVRSRAGTDVVE